MTEDQANLTRCCGPEGCGGNSAGEPERYCIASHCMAWRTLPPVDLTEARAFAAADEKVSAVKALRSAVPTLSLKDAVDALNGVQPWPTVEQSGYCGLAGQP